MDFAKNAMGRGRAWPATEPQRPPATATCAPFPCLVHGIVCSVTIRQTMCCYFPMLLACADRSSCCTCATTLCQLAGRALWLNTVKQAVYRVNIGTSSISQGITHHTNIYLLQPPAVLPLDDCGLPLLTLPPPPPPPPAPLLRLRLLAPPAAPPPLRPASATASMRRRMTASAAATWRRRSSICCSSASTAICLARSSPVSSATAAPLASSLPASSPSSASCSSGSRCAAAASGRDKEQQCSGHADLCRLPTPAAPAPNTPSTQ